MMTNDEVDRWLNLLRELDILELYRLHRQSVADYIKVF